MSKKRPPIPRFTTPLIETHCHLDYLEQTELQEVLAQSSAVGIEKIVTIAVSPDNLDKVLTIAHEHEQVWCTQGVHPHEAELFNDAVAEKITVNASDKNVLAIGEIGLDYYYDHADRKIQWQVFEQQLNLASKLKLPVVIHTREADEDTQAILKTWQPTSQVPGVIHSFTSGMALAQFCLEQGFMLGFNGISTFNKADNVREIIAATPVERIVLETDAPYLTPVPYRGKPNAPYYLPFIAELVANVKQLDIETLLNHAYNNSHALFFHSE